MLKAAWEEKVIIRTTESFDECKKRLYERDWKDKPLHSAFLRDVQQKELLLKNLGDCCRMDI